jgi:hypothetical protein
MRFFLAALLSMAFVHAASARQQNLVIPLKVVLKWMTQNSSGLRAGCSATEIERIDSVLATEMNEKTHIMKSTLGLDELPGDKHLSCSKKVCTGDFHLEFMQVKDKTSEKINHVQDQLLSECTAILHGMASEQSYSPFCQKQLKGAICESSFTLSAI